MDGLFRFYILRKKRINLMAQVTNSRCFKGMAEMIMCISELGDNLSPMIQKTNAKEMT